jgi:hypothetical protein
MIDKTCDAIEAADTETTGRRTIMAGVQMSAKGVNGQLELLEGRIRISRKGVLGFLTQGLKGDKEINISSISSIQWKKAGAFTNGYIQFAFHGGAEAKGGLFQATQDENSIMFTKAQEAEFEKIRDEVHRRVNAGATGSSDSVADEIKKLADLRDQGIITSEEFEAKKKQILGI